MPIVSIDVAVGHVARTRRDLIGDAIEADGHGHAGRAKAAAGRCRPRRSKSGEVVIADIGIPADVIDQLEGPRIELLTREQMRAR